MTIKRGHQPTAEHDAVTEIEPAFPGALCKANGVEQRPTLRGDHVGQAHHWRLIVELDRE